MLRELLKEISAGGTVTVSELARRLNTSEETIRMMLEELERLGLLKAGRPSCSARCEGCPYQAECALPARDKLWISTGGKNAS